jgi:hypothetical protein
MIGSLLRLGLVPVYIAITAVVLVLVALIFIRLADRRYAERLLKRIARLRPLRRRMIHSYIRDLEKTNPVAARAYAKLERISGDASMRLTDAALSVLSQAERRAYLDVFPDEEPALNRAQRRRKVRSHQGRAGGR